MDQAPWSRQFTRRSYGAALGTIASRLLRSARSATIVPHPISARREARSPAVRLKARIDAARDASSLAVARPIPFPAPVTRTVRPRNSCASSAILRSLPHASLAIMAPLHAGRAICLAQTTTTMPCYPVQQSHARVRVIDRSTGNRFQIASAPISVRSGLSRPSGPPSPAPIAAPVSSRASRCNNLTLLAGPAFPARARFLLVEITAPSRSIMSRIRV